MKISEYSNKDFGIAFKRITLALHKHFSNVEWVEDNPDILIVQAVGKGEVDYLHSLRSLSNVVLFQQCYFTTNVPEETWIEIWKQCKLVISFHDLRSYTTERFNFYRTPLGAEPEIFPINKNIIRNLKVFSTGHVKETECLNKVFEACRRTNNKMIHTGEDFKYDPNTYNFINFLPDNRFLNLLQRVQYVTGLRLVEGFEMHCIEGAMTGAVPIVPNLPTYSYYKDFCRYINVEEDITEQLVRIFNSYVPLSTEQIEYVRNEFSWEKICKSIQKEINAS